MRSAGRRVRQSCCSHMTDYRGAAKNHVYKELTTRGNAPDRKASDSVAATLADRQSTPMTAQESGGRTRGCAQKGRPSGEGDALQAAVGGARKCSGAPPPPPQAAPHTAPLRASGASAGTPGCAHCPLPRPGTDTKGHTTRRAGEGPAQAPSPIRRWPPGHTSFGYRNGGPASLCVHRQFRTWPRVRPSRQNY